MLWGSRLWQQVNFQGEFNVHADGLKRGLQQAAWSV